ncbi:hypothetical protein [Nesterenkonia sp. Act20]|uniref:hypothetical protein n=1 Tax=Nesterenkonia sp. Act20 TaxID=1483432 RepID=UPI001C45116B|nr:hypothetical protein [Nesterenkonia sp. Act20]
METPESHVARVRGLQRLRREILGARVTVALDKELEHETPGPTRRLAEMKLPTRLEMEHAQYGPEIPRVRGLKVLHREILGARVTVALDEALGHKTPGPVRRLAEMSLPDAAEFARARRYDEHEAQERV